MSVEYEPYALVAPYATRDVAGWSVDHVMVAVVFVVDADT